MNIALNTSPAAALATIGMSPFALPALPCGIATPMAAILDGYRTAYFSQAETAGDEVEAAADVARHFPATTLPDLAAKLLVAIHHAHPAYTPDDQLAVDPTDFECPQAGELMLSTLGDAIRLAERATSTGNPTFDAAYATYANLRAVERAFPNTDNDAALEAALGEACNRTDAAFNIMFAIPVTDRQRAALKLAAAFERRDIAGCGLLHDADAALIQEALDVMHRETPLPVMDVGGADATLPANGDTFETVLAEAMRASADADRIDDEAITDAEAGVVHGAISALAAHAVATPAQFLCKVTFLAETRWYDSEGDTALLLDDARRMAAVATPLVDRSTWHRNLAAYRSVHAEYSGATAVYGQLLPNEPGHDDALRTAMAAAQADSDAERTLMETPAPDLAAARIKLEVGLETEMEIDYLRPLLIDLERLDGPTEQPVDSAWGNALARYTEAKHAERAYDEASYYPAYRQQQTGGVTMPTATEKEANRLQAVRFEAEDALMAIPAPDATAIAFKFLVAHADGRDANGWNERLVREAMRFVPDFPREAKGDAATITGSGPNGGC